MAPPRTVARTTRKPRGIIWGLRTGQMHAKHMTHSDPFMQLLRCNAFRTGESGTGRVGWRPHKLWLGHVNWNAKARRNKEALGLSKCVPKPFVWVRSPCSCLGIFCFKLYICLRLSIHSGYQCDLPNTCWLGAGQPLCGIATPSTNKVIQLFQQTRNKTTVPHFMRTSSAMWQSVI